MTLGLDALKRLKEGGDITQRRTPRRRSKAKPRENSVVKVVERDLAAFLSGGNVSEQDEPAPIQGEFPVMVIRWVDITVFMVEAFRDSEGNIAPEAMDALAAKGVEMMEFVNAGIVIFEDDFEMIMLHSMSLQPGRTEFWMFPQAVILGKQTIGRIKIEGNSVSVI